MHNQKPSNLAQDQQGIVAILVTLFLMIILTLIILSFASISRREQRNALDRQLSTQAFYAAESGINDARKAVADWIANPTPPNLAKLNTDYMSKCTGGGASPSFASDAGLSIPGTLTGSGAASYTCLLVDPSPPSLEYSKSDEQHVMPIKAKSGNPINTIEVYWDDGSGSNNFGGCPTPPSNPTGPLSNCDAPVLRIELVDSSLSALNDKVFFIYPNTASGLSPDYGSSSTGTTTQASCSAASVPKKCKITVNGLGSAAGYYMRVKGIYSPAALTITANAGVEELTGAQAIIDATGKTTDVERRIQVRVQANDLSGNVPLYGLEGTDKICKKFTIDGINPPVDSGSCWAGGVPD